jgi:hypothetical protein
MLETLRRISALPDAQGRHACGCGHPEMRRLPDGIFHCPACGSEVLPSVAPSALSEFHGCTDSPESTGDAARPVGQSSAGYAADDKRVADQTTDSERGTER